MNYVLHYDIAAIFTCLVVNVLYFSQKRFPTKADRYFRWMCLLVLIATVSDTVSVFTIANAATVPEWINYIINGIFFLSFNTLQVTFFCYMVLITGYDTGNVGKLMKVIAASILFYILVAILFTPFTHHSFYFEDGVYYQGILLPSLYVAAYITMFISIFMMFFSRRKLTAYQKYSSLVVILVSTTFVIIQFIYPELLITNFAASLLLIVLSHSLQNPDDYLDHDLQVFNHMAFITRADEMLRAGKKFDVVAFELENIDYIEQNYGVEVETELLKAMAGNWSSRKSFFYLDGTQFACICEKGEKEIKEFAGEVELFFEKFNLSSEAKLTLRRCRIACPRLAETGEQLLSVVAFSLSESRKENNSELYEITSEKIDRKRNDVRMVQVIKKAIAEKAFEVYFQPIWSVLERRFTVAEALVRMIDSDNNLIMPDQFIPIAEKNGMIIEIGDIVFEKVCEFISSHHLEQLGVRYIEVNLSMVQLMEENLYVRLIEIMKKYNVPGSMIDFEITETSQNKNNAALHRNMRKLIEYGCTFAVDDFGTGLANADYLLEYPFELVKLDRSFVWGARKNEKAQIVLEHAAAMIGKLNLKIVAEGVEDMDQVSKLIDMGCMFLQGYYFEKPIPQERYISFLEDTDNFIREKMPSYL